MMVLFSWFLIEYFSFCVPKKNYILHVTCNILRVTLSLSVSGYVPKPHAILVFWKFIFFDCHTSPIIWFFRFFLLSLSLDVNGDVWLSVAVIVGLWSVWKQCALFSSAGGSLPGSFRRWARELSRWGGTEGRRHWHFGSVGKWYVGSSGPWLWKWLACRCR